MCLDAFALRTECSDNPLRVMTVSLLFTLIRFHLQTTANASETESGEKHVQRSVIFNRFSFEVIRTKFLLNYIS